MPDHTWQFARGRAFGASVGYCACNEKQREDQAVSQSFPDQHTNQADQAPRPAGARKMDSLIAKMTEARQKIFLPRGSAQSRFEPPSYYYDASDSGVLPRWAVDEACRKHA
jgi:hypothetical protein